MNSLLEKQFEIQLDNKTREYGSGDLVEPGVYVDIETGAVVQVNMADELPEGSRVVRYQRRFRRVDSQQAEREQSDKLARVA